MSTHRIRLAGPWEVQPLGAELNPVGDTANCQLPYTAVPTETPAGVVLRRGFHRPTGIDQNSILRIILKANQQPLDVRINNTPAEVCEPVHNNETNLIDPIREYSIDITRSIAAFNQLSVILQNSKTESPAGLENAWLEIQD